MNKAILLSVRPEHAVHIFSGNKRELFLGTRLPRNYADFWVYFYVIKRKPYLAECVVPKGKNGKQMIYVLKDDEIPILSDHTIFNGKVVARAKLVDYGINYPHAWMVETLEIFDKPKELKDFYVFTLDDFYITKAQLTRAPASWQYVWVEGK